MSDQKSKPHEIGLNVILDQEGFNQNTPGLVEDLQKIAKNLLVFSEKYGRKSMHLEFVNTSSKLEINKSIALNVGFYQKKEPVKGEESQSETKTE